MRHACSFSHGAAKKKKNCTYHIQPSEALRTLSMLLWQWSFVLTVFTVFGLCAVRVGGVTDPHYLVNFTTTNTTSLVTLHCFGFVAAHPHATFDDITVLPCHNNTTLHPVHNHKKTTVPHIPPFLLPTSQCTTHHVPVFISYNNIRGRVFRCHDP